MTSPISPFRHCLQAVAAIVLALLLTQPAAAKGKPQPVTPTDAGAGGSEWMAQLERNKGQLDEPLFRAFVDYCRDAVLADLKRRDKAVDPAFLKALEADRDIHDATFAAIYPVDPRVTENMQRLWRELGTELFQRFRHLALGTSVLRRQFGMGEVISPPGNFKQSMFFEQDALQSTDDPDGASDKSPRKNTVPPIELTPAITTTVDAFKKSHADAPLNEIWSDPAAAAELIGLLAKQNVPPEAVADVLKEYLVAKKIHPAARSNAPTVAEYIKALADRLDTPAAQLNFADAVQTGKKKQELTWPVFPVERAPWPVLIGLGLTWPLDESTYIFEKLQGKHGDERLHTYGPYRGSSAKELMTVDSLREIPFGAAAWPMQMHVGGMCGTMSTIGCGTWTTLGLPSYKCGQPKHSCLLTYRVNAAGAYYARVDQAATAGPDNTYCDWPFADTAHPRSRYAETHYGMALAMNKSLSSWFKTRMALHFYRAVTPELRQTIGTDILQQAIAINPFNTELWYILADQAKTFPEKKAVLVRLHDAIKGNASITEHQIKSATADLSDEAPAAAADVAIEKNIIEFRTLVRDIILRDNLGAPNLFAPAERQELLTLMQSWSAQSNRFLAEMKVRYQSSLQDKDAFRADLEKQFNAALSGTYGKDRKVDRAEGDLAVQLAQIQYVLDDRDAREKFLLDLLAAVTTENAPQIHKEEKTLRPAVQAAADALEASYKQSPPRKNELKTLSTMKKGWTN